MSAVAGRHCCDGRFARIVLWRRSREKIPASALLVAGVVCEEVLEQPRRCLACTQPWLADAVNQTHGDRTRRHSRDKYVVYGCEEESRG
jgi:hypothetical protein